MIAELQAEGLVSSEQARNLDSALQTARTVGGAVGIVMTRYRVSEVGAFELLKKASQESNRRLRLVAADVVLMGDLPGPPTG